MEKLGAMIEDIAYEGQPSSVYFGLPLYEKVDLQAMIEKAYADGKSELVLSPGAYRIKPNGAHIRLYNMENFRLDGNGSVLLYDDMHYTGMHISNCINVTVENFFTDYEPFGFSQCKIVAIDPNGGYIDAYVADGYMNDFSGGPYHCPAFQSSFYSGTTRRIMNLRPFAIRPDNVERLGEHLIRVHSPLSKDHRTLLSVGDWFTVTMRYIMASALSINNSGGVHIRNFTVWSGVIGVGESGSPEKNYYDGFSVVPGPRPFGATEERLVSTVADAAHMPNNRVGPTMENGVFHSMGDDGVNFYGHFCRVAEVLSPTEFITAERVALGHIEGDSLRFYTHTTHLIGSAAVQSCEKVMGEYTPKVDLSKALGAVNFRPTCFFRVTLKEPMPLTAGDWFFSENRVGSGFVLRNNRYFNLRPRGALIKASDGLIENCVFEDLGLPGVQIRPELHWAEAGCSHRVTVRNNLFIRCGGARSAALTVEGHAALDQRDILIENNEFIDSPGSDIWLTSASGVTVRGNRFSLGNSGEASRPCVRLGAVENVSFEGNRFGCRGRVEVAAGEHATGITGASPMLLSVASEALASEEQGSGGWHFGYSPIGSNLYFDYPEFRHENKNPDGWHTPDGDEKCGCILRLWGDVYMRPGEECDAVKTYICPMDGRILLGSTDKLIPGEPSADGVHLAVLHGDTPVWETDAYAGDLADFPPLVLDVRAGDAIHFRVNKKGNSEGDGMDWDPTVLYL